MFIRWLSLALYLVSICRGDVRDFVTEDFFNIIVSGDVPLSVEGITTQDFFNGILFATTDGCGKKYSINTMNSLMRPSYSLSLVQTGPPMTIREKLLYSSPTFLLCHFAKLSTP